MALVFERIVTEGLGDLGYLIGDDASGTAAVIDPQIDADRYVEAAQRHKVAITHVFQTHVHEDFLSGARELAARLGNADIYASGEANEPYGYPYRPIRDGDAFDFGSIVLTARHTPGHTPEHMAFLVAETKHRDAPYAVFSGGSLLINAAGRSDLLGPDKAEELVAAQYRTLYDFYLGLPDYVIVHPTHAHGSPCGASIGDRLSSSIGYERRFNPFLQAKSAQEFHDFALAGLPPKPSYYPRLKRSNTEGPAVLGNLPVVPPMAVDQFEKAVARDDAVLLDTRAMLAFGGGHIAGAINIGAAPKMSIWAGWMLDAAKPLLLVLESDDALETVVRRLFRTGFTRFAGYLVGGVGAWANAGLPLQRTAEVTVQELRENPGEYQLLDVRGQAEWTSGHIPGARHIFLPDLPRQLEKLDRNAPVAVYCDSGYRASIGASLLQRQGFGRAANIPGSWQAWRQAGYPVEK